MQTDEQLILLYQGGDAEAFEQLYLRHKNALYRYFFRQLQNTAIADELHQDVWMRIIKSSAPFNQQSLFTTWLFKIAHNRLIDYYRSHKNQLLTEILADESEKKSILSENHSPDKLLEEKQLAKKVLQIVDELPSEQKEVFLLYEHSGLSVKEVAAVTQVSFESCKSRLRYAIKKLRTQLSDLL